MALANFDLSTPTEKVRRAYETDDPLLRKFRDYARSLSAAIKPLRAYSVNAVSFVSADGGDNRLVFNPATVELVRVVDSRGNECALDAIASTAELGHCSGCRWCCADRRAPNARRGDNLVYFNILAQYVGKCSWHCDCQGIGAIAGSRLRVSSLQAIADQIVAQ